MPRAQGNHHPSISPYGLFHCADGYLVMPGYSDAIVYSNKGEEIKRFKGGADHFGNFIKAVRSGKKEDLIARLADRSAD